MLPRRNSLLTPPPSTRFGWLLVASICTVFSLQAQATCLSPAGDITKSGETNIVDVQCLINTVLQAPQKPSCNKTPVTLSDLNCDGSITVTDILLMIYYALGDTLATAIDADGDGYPDACGVEPPVLYLVSMMHAEDAIAFQNNEFIFNDMAGALMELGALFVDHGAKLDFGPDWTFILGVLKWDPSLLVDLLAMGHGIQTHAHETTLSLEAVHDLLMDAGAGPNIIANGGFSSTPPPGENWVGYVASLQDPLGGQLFTSAVGFKDSTTQIPNGIGVCFRPSVTGDWQVPDPNGPLIYIGSNTVEEPKAGSLEFDTVRDWIDDRLDNLDPCQVNTLYWHDSLHNYSDPTDAAVRIAEWEVELEEYFDPLVAEGKIAWVTFAELTQICLDAEQ